MKWNVLFLSLGMTLLGVVGLGWLLRADSAAEAEVVHNFCDELCASGKANTLCVEGTWAVRLPDGRIARMTLIGGPLGRTAHYSIEGVTAEDATLGGLFPNASGGLGPARGSMVRIGPGEFNFRTLAYAANLVEGVPSEIAYIRIDDGVVVFPGCDTAEFTLTSSFFLPEQDTDGDGLPDEGKEPFLTVPDLSGSGTRFFP